MSQCAVASGDCDHDILMKFLLLGDTGLHFSMANVLVLLVEFKLHYSYCGGGAVVVRRCWKIVFAPALCRWHLCSKLSLHLDLQKQKSLNVSHSNGDLCPKWFKIYALSDPPAHSNHSNHSDGIQPEVSCVLWQVQSEWISESDVWHWMGWNLDSQMPEFYFFGFNGQ